MASKGTANDTPLSEWIKQPTLNLRMRALYQHRGYTRADMARMLDVDYSLVHAWDKGRWVISLTEVTRVAQLLKVSLDELVLGEPRPSTARRDLTSVREILDELRASPDVRAAFGEYLVSEMGILQNPDREYVATWVEGYSAAIAEGAPRERASQRAHGHAINAFALRGAVEHREELAAAVELPRKRKRPQRPRRKLPTTKSPPTE
jgi:transcriptional regulator with XRE-family HTH domain